MDVGSPVTGKTTGIPRELPSTVGSTSTLDAQPEQKRPRAHVGVTVGGSDRAGRALHTVPRGLGFPNRVEWAKAGEWPFLVANFKNNVCSV